MDNERQATAKQLEPPERVDSPGSGELGAQPLRVWPAVLVMASYWAFVGWVIVAEPPGIELFFVQLTGSPFIALSLFVWWVVLSRARKWERLLAPLVAFVGLGATLAISPSRLAGTIPIDVILYGIPSIATLGTAVSLLSRQPRPSRTWAIPLSLAIGWGGWMTLRYEGAQSNIFPSYGFRWTPTAEEQYLAERASSSRPERQVDDAPSKPIVARPDDWPEFRGRRRDGTVDSIRIDTAWDESPPQQQWQRRLGLGWGSMAVAGGRLWTQEQRGDDECVVCYDAETGEEIWVRSHQARYQDPPSGAGPRATPTFADGKVIAAGATGELVCLDAATGHELWNHQLLDELPPPGLLWGYSTSPLVVDGLVIAFAPRPDSTALAAFRLESGELAWRSGEGKISHASPQLADIQGVQQVLFVSDQGLESLDSASGKRLWFHATTHSDPALQPVLFRNDRILYEDIVLEVTKSDAGWSVNEILKIPTWKLTFNDRVVVDSLAYGFDGAIFGCIDLQSGRKRWKKGRYGSGQVLLIRDQGILLVITEQGELVAVRASGDELVELGRFPAITGKTWNHAAIAGDRLYLRNGEQMACYRLTRLGDEE